MYSNDESLLFMCMCMLFLMFLVSVVTQWILFEKAGIAGWKSLIPVYNSYLINEMAMGNGLFFLLNFVPIVNFFYAWIFSIQLARAFGKDLIFGILTALFAPIMYLILALGKARYIGPQPL